MFYFRELVYPAILYAISGPRNNPEKIMIPLSNFAAQLRRFWNLSTFKFKRDRTSENQEMILQQRFADILINSPLQSIMRPRRYTDEYDDYYDFITINFKPRVKNNLNLSAVEISDKKSHNIPLIILTNEGKYRRQIQIIVKRIKKSGVTKYDINCYGDWHDGIHGNSS